jgi:hypothetical protein
MRQHQPGGDQGLALSSTPTPTLPLNGEGEDEALRRQLLPIFASTL